MAGSYWDRPVARLAFVLTADAALDCGATMSLHCSLAISWAYGFEYAHAETVLNTDDVAQGFLDEEERLDPHKVRRLLAALDRGRNNGMRPPVPPSRPKPNLVVVDPQVTS